MKKILVVTLLVFFVLPLTGCALFGPHNLDEKVDSLERRVNRMERRQVVSEVQPIDQTEIVTVVEDTRHAIRDTAISPQETPGWT